MLVEALQALGVVKAQLDDHVEADGASGAVGVGLAESERGDLAHQGAGHADELLGVLLPAVPVVLLLELEHDDVLEHGMVPPFPVFP